MALQSDNKIVITGGFRYPTQLLPVITQGFSLARFNTDGTLDLTFGLAGLGYILSDLVSSIYDNEIGYSVAIQSDGKVLVGGTVLNIEDSGANRYFILARYFWVSTLSTSYTNRSDLFPSWNTCYYRPRRDKY